MTSFFHNSAYDQLVMRSLCYHIVHTGTQWELLTGNISLGTSHREHLTGNFPQAGKSNIHSYLSDDGYDYDKDLQRLFTLKFGECVWSANGTLREIRF